MSSTDKSLYSPVLTGNMMIVGGTDTGKTSYLQEIILNGFLSENIKKIYWISGIHMSEDRLDQITTSFKNYEIKFTHVHDKSSFIKVLNNLKQLSDSQKEEENGDNIEEKQNKTESESDISTDSDNENKDIFRKKNFIGEHIIAHSLVVFDDISKIFEQSTAELVHFLTVCRKFGYGCIYILHYLKTKWIPIIEQTKIFVFFKTSGITTTMTNFLRDQAVQINKHAYRTNRKNWLYQVFIDQVQRGAYQSHLLLDMRRLNEMNPPSLIRGQTNNKLKQTCFFVSFDNDNDYDTYISQRINKEHFKIKSSVGKTNFGNQFRLKADRNLKRINIDTKYNFKEEYSTDSNSSTDTDNINTNLIRKRKNNESTSNKKRRRFDISRGKPRWSK